MEFPSIDPVAFAIGPFEVRWYALAYLAGFLLGWRYALHIAGRSPEQKPGKEDIDDFIPWAILGVILGGRLGYILFYQLEYYLENPMNMLKVWQGGMAFHGGALGVIVAMLLYGYIRRFNPVRLADIVCCVVPIGLFFGRIANFINGELYGRVANVPWAVQFERAGEEPRHPSQLYEAILEGAVLFAVLFLLMRVKAIRERSGILSGVFLAGYASARFFVEFFREPDAHLGFVVQSFSMGQVLSVPMFLFGVFMIFYGLRHGKPT